MGYSSRKKLIIKTSFICIIVISIILLIFTFTLYTLKYTIPTSVDSSYTYDITSNITIDNRNLSSINTTISSPINDSYLNTNNSTILSSNNITTSSPINISKSSYNISQNTATQSSIFYENKDYIYLFKKLASLVKTDDLTEKIAADQRLKDPKIDKKLLDYLVGINIEEVKKYSRDYYNIKKLFSNYNMNAFKMNGNVMDSLSALDYEIDHNFDGEVIQQGKEITYKDFKIKYLNTGPRKKYSKFSITSTEGLKYALIRTVSNNEFNYLFRDIQFNKKKDIFTQNSDYFLKIIFKVAKSNIIWYLTEDYEKDFHIKMDSEGYKDIISKFENLYESFKNSGYYMNNICIDNIVFKKKSFNEKTILIPKIINTGFYEINNYQNISRYDNLTLELDNNFYGTVNFFKTQRDLNNPKN